MHCPAPATPAVTVDVARIAWWSGNGVGPGPLRHHMCIWLSNRHPRHCCSACRVRCVTRTSAAGERLALTNTLSTAVSPTTGTTIRISTSTATDTRSAACGGSSGRLVEAQLSWLTQAAHGRRVGADAGTSTRARIVSTDGCGRRGLRTAVAGRPATSSPRRAGVNGRVCRGARVRTYNWLIIQR